jgi:hypothetical protein
MKVKCVRKYELSIQKAYHFLCVLVLFAVSIYSLGKVKKWYEKFD